MTITDASNVNRLLDWILKRRTVTDRLVTDAEALEAAVGLADKAYKALYAGIHPDDVRRSWKRKR